MVVGTGASGPGGIWRELARASLSVRILHVIGVGPPEARGGMGSNDMPTDGHSGGEGSLGLSPPAILIQSFFVVPWLRFKTPRTGRKNGSRPSAKGTQRTPLEGTKKAARRGRQDQKIAKVRISCAEPFHLGGAESIRHFGHSSPVASRAVSCPGLPTRERRLCTGATAEFQAITQKSVENLPQKRPPCRPEGGRRRAPKCPLAICRRLTYIRAHEFRFCF